ncbi:MULTISPECIES: MFS transporter [unclassified Variovorax]|uniref:MFS transporter n=1 Tax=unclassified Variovorax TaxID=663243 RepID=UPI001BD30AC4|nr:MULTISPECIES: MFS transporter [unclassified Variovorax]
MKSAAAALRESAPTATPAAGAGAVPGGVPISTARGGTGSEFTAAQRLDRLPETRFHRRMAAMIGLGLFFDGFDLYMASGVMVALASIGWSDMQSNAYFASAGAVGTLIGAFMSGWLGDRFGRKFTFQFNLALFGITSLAAAFVPSMNWLIALRFLMGIGLGAEIVVGYATISEFVPPRSRGRWGAVLFFLATASLLASNAIAYLVIPTLGWRWMFAIAGLGGLCVWIMRKKMPESPRWLESVGRLVEASRIVDEIEAEVIRETGRPLPIPARAAVLAPTSFRASDLFRPPILRSTILGIVLNIVALSALYGFIIWLPTFLMKQGLSVGASLGHTTLISAGSLVGVLLAGFIADRWSRRKWIASAAVVAAVFGWWYANAGSLNATTAVGVCLIAAMYFGSTVGFSTYVPELFPTELRLRGTGISSVAGRAASIVAPQAVAALFAFGGVNAVTYTIVALLLAQAVIVGFLGLETTGRSLDTPFAGH